MQHRATRVSGYQFNISAAVYDPDGEAKGTTVTMEVQFIQLVARDRRARVGDADRRPTVDGYHGKKTLPLRTAAATSTRPLNQLVHGNQGHIDGAENIGRVTDILIVQAKLGMRMNVIGATRKAQGGHLRHNANFAA